MTYGWYHLFHGQRERIEYGREKAWARIHLTPLLQAEEDRDQVRRYYADLSREKQLLGRESGAYNSDRYVLIRSCRGVWQSGRPRIGKRLEADLSVIYRFVRPTFAVTPGNRSKD